MSRSRTFPPYLHPLRWVRAVVYLEAVLESLLDAAFYRLLVFFQPPSVKAPDTAAKRILVVRPDEIGDFILSTPFLRELRRLYPLAEITLVVKSQVAELARPCPYVDEVLTYDGRVARLARLATGPLKAWFFARKHLRRRDFDLAVLPRWGVDWYYAGLLAYFSGATQRVGFASSVNRQKKVLNLGCDVLYTRLLHTPVGHEVAQNLEMIRALGGEVRDSGLELWCQGTPPELREPVHGPGPLVGLGLGGSSGKKRWPAERFLELARWLSETKGARLLVVGSRQDAPAAAVLKSALGERVLDATGRASLTQTALLLKECSLYIGNDSGPMHLAAAMGVPVVELSWHSFTSPAEDPSSPLRFAPWGVCHAILRPRRPVPPCSAACLAFHAHCILEISVEEVKGLVEGWLSRGWENLRSLPPEAAAPLV
jgi:heptosyltransferase-2